LLAPRLFAGRWPIPHSAVVGLGVLLALLVTACSDAVPAVGPAPQPTPISFTPIEKILALEAAGREVSTAGYLLVADAGAELVDRVSFSAGATPRPLAGAEARIWLGADIVPSLKGMLRSAGDTRYAIVLARGRLDRPGNYGPGGIYRYQMTAPTLQLLSPEETTIATLIDQSADYDGRVVRVVGALLSRSDSALLIEKIGTGGMPAPKARQIKIQAPIGDKALLDRLQGPPGGAIRYGQVQVEGFWQDGMLVPLSIVLIT
jgi:hypothetical protein